MTLLIFFSVRFDGPNKVTTFHLSSRAQPRDLRCTPAPTQRSPFRYVLPQIVILPAPYVHRMPMSRPADMPIDC